MFPEKPLYVVYAWGDSAVREPTEIIRIKEGGTEGSEPLAYRTFYYRVRPFP